MAFTSGIQLLLGDYNFLFTQITLPNNQPVLITDPTGIRDLTGQGNNLLNPTWGSVDTPFLRFTFNSFQAGIRNSGATYTGFGASLGPITFNWGPSAAGLTYMGYTDPGTANASGVAFNNDLNYSKHYGGFTSTKLSSGPPATYSTDSGWGFSTSYVVDYSVRGTTIVDANPRLISNLISNQADQLLLAVQDDPTTTPDGRINPLTGLTNPLPYSMYLASWGQYFDHGLDLVLKGVDGKVQVPILPGDDMYTGPGQYLTVSRTNTYNVTIQSGSTDSLMTSWGLDQSGTPVFGPVRSTSELGNGPFTGGLLLNGTLIRFSNADRAGVVTAINAQSVYTGVTASLDDRHLLLTPLSGESRNTISPPTDLSQEYGSAPSQLVFISEWVKVNGIPTKTGQLLNHSVNGIVQNSGGGFGSQSRWSDVKANAALLGLTLHDYNVGDTPLLKFNADGSLYLDAQGRARFLAVNNTTGVQVEILDTALNTLASNGYTLLTTGHAFLNDRGPFSLASDGPPGFPYQMTAAGDNPANYDSNMAAYFTANNYGTFQPLNEHLIAGDGRTNENIGLSSIQEIWHSEHNRNVANIIDTFGLVKNLNAGVWDGTYTAFQTPASQAAFAGAGVIPAADIWTGEMLQQAAKVLTESTYQHVIFQEFIRKLSPNIGAFQGYNINLDPAVSAEFASSVYRFGHSMLGEVLDMKYAAGTTEHRSLLSAFLAPTTYGTTTAADLARGLTNQVGNELDEWVTDTLRNHLVGQKLDLATANIVRGRDSGVPSWNDTRASLYQQTGLVNLAPYQNWSEVGANLLHGMEALKEFVMAYAHDDILTRYYDTLVANGAVPGTDVPSTNTLAAWAEFQLDPTKADIPGIVGNDGTYSGPGGVAPTPRAYSLALSAAADLAMADVDWMGTDGNQDFWNIDLWTGGLAEGKAQGSMLGTTMDCIFSVQMNNLQNADRMYYITRLGAAQNILPSMDEMTLADLVMRNTGATHLYSDIFSVPDQVIEIKDFINSNGTPKTGTTYSSVLALKASGAVAGWVGSTTSGWTFTDNPGDYLDARGVQSPNGIGNASSLIGGTSFAEKINGLGGNETIWGDGGNDTVDGGVGNDFLHGGDGNDVMSDAGGDDFLWGDGGDDKLNGGDGIDLVIGGVGNDSAFGGLGADGVNGDDGNDYLYGGDGKVVNGTMDALDGGDVIHGGRGDDTIFGGGGNDVVDGGEGNDVIYGGIDNNLLQGFSGDDSFIVDATHFGYQNAFSGGIGHDIVDYRASNGQLLGGIRVGINIDLGNVGAGIVIPAGRNVKDVFLSIEEVYGSAFNDIITTGNAIQVDALGNPILGPGGLPLPVDSTVHGMAGNDSLNGGLGNDTLDGGAGSDTMTGGLGDDTYLVGEATDVVIEAIAEGTDTVVSTISYTLTPELENLILAGTANINGTGNDLDNIITGNSGNNIIDGAAGADQMLGGAGNDTYYVDNAGDQIFENLNQGTDTIIASFDYILGLNLENLTLSGTAVNGTGNALSNVVTGNAGNNVLRGLVGNDTLNGGDGDDTLDGGTGTDVLVGGNGNDVYIVDTTTDTITELAGGGTDTVQSSVTFTLATNVENLILTGTANINGTGNASNNVITGNTGNNLLQGLDGNDTLNGGGGNDTLDGGLGNDQMNGLTGDDVYVVDSLSDVINDTSGIDTVRSSITYTLAAGLENLTLTGTSAINGTGNTGNNVIIGNTGNNTLNGGAGADTLTGGTGADTFRLAALTDSLVGTRDSVTDFVIGTDVFDGPTAVSSANISKVNVGVAFSATALAGALTNTNFVASGASLLTFTDGTYLALNNNQAGWSASTDAVLKFTYSGTVSSFAIV